jgi:hypothetical protein
LDGFDLSDRVVGDVFHVSDEDAAMLSARGGRNLSREMAAMHRRMTG